MRYFKLDDTTLLSMISEIGCSIAYVSSPDQTGYLTMFIKYSLDDLEA